MTQSEHLLLVLIYFKQQKAIRILLDMLRSHGLLTADDEKAFAFAQTANAPSNAALFDEAKSNYMKIAESLGIQTGLEQLPEPPVEWFRPT